MRVVRHFQFLHNWRRKYGETAEKPASCRCKFVIIYMRLFTLSRYNKEYFFPVMPAWIAADALRFSEGASIDRERLHGPALFKRRQKRFRHPARSPNGLDSEPLQLGERELPPLIPAPGPTMKRLLRMALQCVFRPCNKKTHTSPVQSASSMLYALQSTKKDGPR